MELYAARHGETISNLKQLLTGGEGDSPLTEKGREQARQLGKSLQNISFDAVYTSPLGRAQDTVRIALGDRYPIRTDPRLAEIGLGPMEGLSYEAASQAFPQSGMLFFTDPANYQPPINGESYPDMIKRISGFLEDLSKEPYETVFLQTHGTVLRVLYACSIDASITAIANSPTYSNCDLAHFTYPPCRG